MAALRWSVVGVLLGRAWTYCYWDSPWRSLFWDESLLSGLVGTLGWEWSAWATSPGVEQGITRFTTLLGVVFLLGALLSGSDKWQRRRWLWLCMSLLLLLHTLLDWKGHAWQWGYLLEHSLQWTAPLWYTLLWPMRADDSCWWLLAKLAIAFTFVGHGLYAMGYYPVPPHFVGMMMQGFGLSETSARLSLFVIGCLDVLAAVALFVPVQKIARAALWYIIVWALLTALARLYTNMAWYTYWELLTQWLPEFMVRWCHFLVPVAVWLRSLAHVEN
ncbi:MAG: hypothetical protein D6772_16025 [Bacteroidetes bacterium]|nr:MAG: hypothetical protein D6772_16025 [Bacteroidota bacterium]